MPVCPKVVLVGGDSSGKGSVGQRFGELVAQKVAERTGGQLTIDYHPNAELGGDEDLLRQLRANDIQLVVGQMAPVTAFVPEGAVFDLPWSLLPMTGKPSTGYSTGTGPSGRNWRRPMTGRGSTIWGPSRTAPTG